MPAIMRDSDGYPSHDSPTGSASTVPQTGPSGTRHRIRSGDEPVHARSPLRLRLGLALIGLANGLAGVIVFALLGSAPLTWAFAVLSVVAAANIAVVARHIRQGAHYQPGRTIPPYRPLASDEPVPSPHTPAPTRVRRRRYLAMMGVCVVLLILAWGWIRLYSVTAAVIMSAVASLIPPFAAVLANVDSPILRDDADDQR
jgi:drug/metabolite transporter (DMT)-like permease